MKEELKRALFELSCGKLSECDSSLIAETVLKTNPFDNYAIAHKGVRWYAKEIIKRIK